MFTFYFEAFTTSVKKPISLSSRLVEQVLIFFSSQKSKTQDKMGKNARACGG
jgi:hypothetical protein